MRSPRRSGSKVVGQLQDVADHLERLRTHYFDIVSATPGEICVTLRPKATKLPAGFRPRTRR